MSASSSSNHHESEGLLYFGRSRRNSKTGPVSPVNNVHHIDKQESPNSNKLGTFDGVFIPTTLNVLSILMFLRFGFILCQSGILGMFGLLIVSYAIDLLTTLSISAIATNGTVKGGGAYYMISRSLGPEFGGSIGLVFYVGQVLNAGMNVVGFCEPFLQNFGNENGLIAKIMPEGKIWMLIYSTILLLLCSGISLKQSLFAKTGRWLFVILIFSTFTVPLSAFFVKPFVDAKFGAYTGFSFQTLKENMMPSFKPVPDTPAMNFQVLFGIFFPATAGIFAGASMSGDLKNPSVSIPAGTLKGLLLTFISYSLVIITMGACISRDMLYNDVQVLQNVNISKYFIIMGEFSTSLFSAIVGIIGSAKQLQAVARDEVLPFTSAFAKGTPVTDDPIAAVVFTYILAQIIIFFDVNQIATFITMAFLMTFIVTNLACFLLRIASAPNFRPSFRYFNSYTAAAGAAASIAAMFVADGMTASLMMIILAALFLTIHYISPPKPWGDVSQSLIYHQVRKYLLRLRQDHVKFWRPQILLLVDDPRTALKLIYFCNSLKKGGLYVLGHVVVTQDFQNSFHEIKKQQDAWKQLRDVSGVKAFIQISAGPDLVWGARNVYLGSGLGGMRPNITVLGFFEKQNHLVGSQIRSSSIPATASLPTDDCRHESTINVQHWVNIIEDLLIMRANVAVAKGFPQLELPSKNTTKDSKLDSDKKYIDLYPIQMSAQIIDKNGETSALTTNFDTYTLILQMGAILNTVPSWKQNYTLRVIVFVEYEEDVEEEESRIKILLEQLRIKAVIVVICLNSGNNESYEVIVRGKKDKNGRIENVLSKLEWWQNLQSARREYERKYGIPVDLSRASTLPADHIDTIVPNDTNVANSGNVLHEVAMHPSHVSRLLKTQKRRRHTMSSIQQMGLSFSMQTSKILKSQVRHATDFFRDEADLDDYSSDSDSATTGTESDASSINESFQSPRNSLASKPKISVMSHDHVSTINDRIPKSAQPKQDPPIFKPIFTLEEIPNKTESGKKPYFLSPQDDPVSGPIYDATKLTPAFSRSSRNSSRPNFTGLAIPRTTVEEIDDGRPTIKFDTKTQKKKRVSSKKDSLDASLPKETTSLLASDSQCYNTLNTGDRGEYIKQEELNVGYPQQEGPKSTEDGDDEDDDNGNEDSSYLSFNDLPADAQHLILNDMMRTTSKHAAVIFSTLPAPFFGTHLSEEESYQYVESLELWCQDLPPILLLNSQTITVTTAL